MEFPPVVFKRASQYHKKLGTKFSQEQQCVETHHCGKSLFQVGAVIQKCTGRKLNKMCLLNAASRREYVLSVEHIPFLYKAIHCKNWDFLTILVCEQKDVLYKWARHKSQGFEKYFDNGEKAKQKEWMIHKNETVAKVCMMLYILSIPCTKKQ